MPVSERMWGFKSPLAHVSEFGNAAVRVASGGDAFTEAGALVASLSDDEVIDLLDRDSPF